MQKLAKRTQPVEPLRALLDRIRENRDPDPFNLK